MPRLEGKQLDHLRRQNGDDVSRDLVGRERWVDI